MIPSDRRTGRRECGDGAAMRVIPVWRPARQATTGTAGDPDLPGAYTLRSLPRATTCWPPAGQEGCVGERPLAPPERTSPRAKIAKAPLTPVRLIGPRLPAHRTACTFDRRFCGTT